MILPEKHDRRRELAVEVGRQCLASRDTRAAYNMECRQWYVAGAQTGERAIYNKLKTHVRQSAAYLYQSESARFWLTTPTRYGDAFAEELDVARDDFHRLWHDSNAGLTIATGVRWAHVYPSVVFKVTAQGRMPCVSLVPNTADIGVFEEDRPFNRQEAYTHCFYLNMAQFRRLIAGHPRADQLMRKAIAWSDLGTGNEITGGVAPMMVFDNVGAPLEGGGALVQGPSRSDAMIDTPRILCCEVWVVDDRLHDWRVFTALAPDGNVADIIWDRRTPGLSGVDPFVQLSLDDPPDYTWGFSEVDDLSGLQSWRERRMEQIDQLMVLQLDPPIVLGGFGGLSDERAKRLREPGGTLSTSIPNPTVHRNAPQMPTEAFGEIDAIDKQFADQGGLPILFSGQGEPGIRAGNQVGVLATLASARIREMAMRVEHAVSEVATLTWRYHRLLEDEPLRKPDGSRFYLTQLPRETTVLVAAHSASPLYAAAIKAEADNMRKQGAIGLEDYVTMKDPPGVDVLRAKARKIEQNRAAQADRLMKLREVAALHGRGGSTR